jgi:hypothetical protein
MSFVSHGLNTISLLFTSVEFLLRLLSGKTVVLMFENWQRHQEARRVGRSSLAEQQGFRYRHLVVETASCACLFTYGASSSSLPRTIILGAVFRSCLLYAKSAGQT